MARRREEIRVAVLEEKARVERADESVEEVWRKKRRHYRAAARAEERERRRGEGSRRLAEESSRAHVPRWNRIRQPSALITTNGTIAN